MFPLIGKSLFIRCGVCLEKMSKQRMKNKCNSQLTGNSVMTPASAARPRALCRVQGAEAIKSACDMDLFRGGPKRDIESVSNAVATPYPFF